MFVLVCQSFCLSILLVSWSFAPSFLPSLLPSLATPLLCRLLNYILIHCLFCLQSDMFSLSSPLFTCPIHCPSHSSLFPLPFSVHLLSPPSFYYHLSTPTAKAMHQRKRNCLAPTIMSCLARTTFANCPPPLSFLL